MTHYDITLAIVPHFIQLLQGHRRHYTTVVIGQLSLSEHLVHNQCRVLLKSMPLCNAVFLLMGSTQAQPKIAPMIFSLKTLDVETQHAFLAPYSPAEPFTLKQALLDAFHRSAFVLVEAAQYKVSIAQQPGDLSYQLCVNVHV